MKKLRKKQIITGGIVIIVAIILVVTITASVIKNNNVLNEGYLATTSNASSNLVSKYIKKGITIGGITGTLEVTETGDATASSMNLDYGETAYINGEKVEGRKLSTKALGIVFEEDTVLYDVFNHQFVVPKGFKIISDAGITTKDGIIVEDEKENQYVWVRVANPQEIFGEEANGINLNGISVKTYIYSILTGSAGLPGDSSKRREPDITYNVGVADDYYNYDTNPSYYRDILEFDSYEDMAQSFVDDYKAMSDSVKKYNGFYIGRYELTGSIFVPTEKSGKTLVSNWYNMYKACKNLVKEHNTVTSTMIWGVQWDATCTWLKESGWNTDTYSSTWGKYGEDTTLEVETGSDSRYEANGIFDFAGNNYEWTQEVSANNAKVMRGGCCRVNGAVEPAASRRTQRPSYSTRAYGGTRATLYVK